MTEALGEHLPKESDDDLTTETGEALPASSARFGAFTDAVVAIAMTLLILPLTESISGAKDQDLSTAAYLSEHALQILSFVLSFVLIGMFWLLHHRAFRADTPHSARMAVVNFAWMLTIVFLPVPTSMVGVLRTDRLQIVLYIGTMLVSSLLLLWLCELQRRARHAAGLVAPNKTILATPLALAILYTVALGVGMIPYVTFFGLFLMALTGPLRALLIRFIHD